MLIEKLMSSVKAKRKFNKSMPWYARVLFSKDWELIQSISVKQVELLTSSIDEIDQKEYNDLSADKKKIMRRLLALEPENPILLDAYSDTLKWRKNIVKYKVEALKFVRSDDDELRLQLKEEILQLKKEAT